MILMSKYKGQHGGKRVKNSGNASPLFGQCPKEINFFLGGVPLRMIVIVNAFLYLVTLKIFWKTSYS